MRAIVIEVVALMADLTDLTRALGAVLLRASCYDLDALLLIGAEVATVITAPIGPWPRGVGHGMHLTN